MNPIADLSATSAPPAEQSRPAPCPSETDTDPVLITRFLNGDERAFDTLMLRHQQRAFAVAFALLGNREDAAEVVQDAFVKIYNSLASFRRDSAFTTWLFRIVTNLAHNKNRHSAARGKGRIVPIENSDGNPLPIADTRRDAAAEAIANESQRRLLDALDELSAEHREVIVLFSLEQMSYEQIAQALETSIGTVKSRIFRAREELTKLLRKP